MKSIIDNKLYDTEKAELIYTYKHRWFEPLTFNPKLGFENWETAEVYKTKNNNYFVYFQQKGYDERTRIEPTTEDKIKKTISDIDPDSYIKLFGIVEEA